MAFNDSNDFFVRYSDAQGNFLCGIRRDGCIAFQDGSFIGSAFSNSNDVFQVMPSDGAVTIKGGTVLITKTSQAHISVPAPAMGADPLGMDGNLLRFVSATNYAHVLNFPTNGIQGPSGLKSTCTMVPGGASLNAHFIAYNGLWIVDGVSNASLS